MVTATAAATGVRGRRIATVDALRGIAIMAMIVYHFSWDLRYFGFISVNVVADPGWKAFARTIAGTFVALVGVSLVLATREGFRPRSYLRRLAVIAGAAALVTIGTWYVFPDAYVFFGILHLIAFASVAGLPFLWLPIPVVLVVGIAVFVLPFFFTADVFASPALLWLGLSPRLPTSVDYVPVFPWFAMTLFGIVIGRLFVRYASDGAVALWTPSHLPGRVAILAGRWSLLIYLLHQPIMIGALSAVAPFAVNSNSAVTADQFVSDCATQCRVGGLDQPTCEATCRCVLSGMEDAGLPLDIDESRLTAVQRDRWITLVRQCVPTDGEAPPGSAGN
jgi:uncharacterized membrane protein